MNFLETFFPDYFSQVDRRWVYSSITLSVLSLVALITVRPSFNTNNKKVVAEIITYKNKVKFKDSSSLSFYDVGRNELLRNKDEVFTGANSIAEVRFIRSKTKIKIPSSSLVRIEDDGSGETIELKEGLVDIVLEKGSSINLRMNGLIKELKTAKDIAEIKAFLTNGKLSLYSDDLSINNRSGNFEIVSPVPGENISTDEAIKVVMNKPGKYVATLSKHAEFNRGTSSVTFSGDNYAWSSNLDVGDYYLKVTLDKEEQIIPVRLTSKFLIDGIIPADGEMLNLFPGESVRFSWNDVGAKSYKIQTRDVFNNVQNYLTSTNEVVVKNLKGPEIEWSISPEIKDGKYSNATKTIKTQLNFKGKIDLLGELKNSMMSFEKMPTVNWNGGENLTYLVRVLKNVEEQEVLRKTIKANNFELPILKKGTYHLEISSVEYPGLKKVEHEFDVKDPVLTWSGTNEPEIRSTEDINKISLKYKMETIENLKPKVEHKIYNKKILISTLSHNLDEMSNLNIDVFGKHCLIAIPTVLSKYIGPSQEHCFEMIKTPVFPPLLKNKDLILEYVKKNGVDTYKINLPAVEKATKYKIEIYKQANATELVYVAEGSSSEFFWSTNRSGIYFLRYKVFDSRNRSSDLSPVSKLIFPISPLSNW